MEQREKKRMTHQSGWGACKLFYVGSFVVSCVYISVYEYVKKLFLLFSLFFNSNFDSRLDFFSTYLFEELEEQFV